MAGDSVNPIGPRKEVAPATQLQRNVVGDSSKTDTSVTDNPKSVDKDKTLLENKGSNGSGGQDHEPTLLEAVNKNREKILASFFNYIVTPVAFASMFTSLGAYFKKDSDLLEKASGALNRIGYFVNGLYGSVNGAFTKDLVGTVGYGIVSLASIVGNSENLYYLKGPGSATDQLPAVNEDAAYYNEIKKEYKLKDGKEEDFKIYTKYSDSVKKTFDVIKAVCSGIISDFKKKKSEGFFKAIWDIFAKDKEKRAGRNIVVSSIGMYLGSFLGLFPKLRTAGKVIRDIFGAHADLGLFAKGTAVNKAGDKVGSNLKYMLSGVLYELGSLTDLVYRLTNMDKLNHVAVGFDNAGFWFMNWAYGSDNKKNRERLTESPK